MSSLLVKAYLHPDSGKQEIRRLYVDEEHTRSYSAFLPKVTAAFPELKSEDTAKLYWKDNDNELVSVSTDAELADAFVNQSSKDRVRVFLKTKDTPSADGYTFPDECWKWFHDQVHEGKSPTGDPCGRGWLGRNMRWFMHGWRHPQEDN